MSYPNDILFKGFEPYQRACDLANELGLAPLRTPARGDYESLVEIINRVLPKVRRDRKETLLAGVILYVAEDQADNLAHTSFGFTVCDEDKQIAVIGLSFEMLRLMPGSFSDLVLLHELSHLLYHNHGDDFQAYNNWLTLQYFTAMLDRKGEPRFDSADKIINHYRDWRI